MAFKYLIGGLVVVKATVLWSLGDTIFSNSEAIVPMTYSAPDSKVEVPDAPKVQEPTKVEVIEGDGVESVLERLGEGVSVYSSEENLDPNLKAVLEQLDLQDTFVEIDPYSIPYIVSGI